MANLMFLREFNNYFNRKIITFYDYDDYNAEYDSQSYQNINFNPNDSVNTTHIQNWDRDWMPDYLVVTDSEGALDSRWFVTESVRIRGKQYKFNLKRDTISDFRSKVLNATTFIEKAILPPDNKLIYNSEGMSFNQIKTSETLLKDETGMAWVVGYCVQDSNRYPASQYYTGSSEIKTIISSNNIPLWIKNSFGTVKKFALDTDDKTNLGLKFQVKSYKKMPFRIGTYYGHLILTIDNIYSSTGHVLIDSFDNDNFAAGHPDYASLLDFNFDWPGFFSAEAWALTNQPWYDYMCEVSSQNIASMGNVMINSLSQNQRVNIMSNLRNDLNIDSYSNYQNLLKYNGLIYKDGNKYYKIKVQNVSTATTSKNYAANSVENAFYYFKTGLGLGSDSSHNNGSYTVIETTSDKKGVQMFVSYRNVLITREEVYSGYVEVSQEVYDNATIQTYIPQTRQHLLQQPYDMFCIPYGEMQCNGWKTISDVALLAGRIMAKSGIGASDAIIYDVQLLPYCPVRELLVNGQINESLLTLDKDYTYIKDQFGNNLSIMLWCRNCDFTFNIESSFQIPRFTNNNSMNIKIASECDIYRLCSPNYNGVFEFNLAKNGGIINYFNVDCTYKPFNPYIHINFDFNGLYGQDFNDSRGLICGGDFSIATLTDRWAQYELQNKNYQQIFNTKIDTLDSFSDLARTNLYIKTANDVLNNNAAATFHGAKSGGVAGAIVAGVQSTVNSAVSLGTGLYNIDESNRILKNQMVNNFQYQLGNIKALPASLSKTTAFTANNKIFPFVEYYTATNEEKDLLKEKIKYDGMTVMKIGKIQDYISGPELNFIKGQIIRLEGIADDTHIFNDIYNEIKQGVYL